MKRTVSSLAILKVNWDFLKKDYIENFIPFIATLIIKKDYATIIVDEICKGFSEEFGLIIPYHPMVTIINRARKRGLIKRVKGNYYTVKEKALELDFGSVAKEQERKLQKVINVFNSFIKDKYSKYCDEIDNEKAEAIIISFLKKYDLDILFASQEKSVLPDVPPSLKENFLVNMFIKYSYENEPDIFNFIVDIAVGYVLANAIIYNQHRWFDTKLRGVYFYFDTRFILRLLGIEGDKRQTAYIDFLNSIKEQGGKLLCFRHNQDELMAILENCLKWIDKPNIDFLRAGSALNFFIQEGYKQSDIEDFINKVVNTLTQHSINIVDTPHSLKYQEYQIDEGKLKEVIVSTYKETMPGFQEKEVEFTILRDINSISAIYKLRKGGTPKNIREAGHVFVTTNSGLANANRKFELSLPDYTYALPGCLTDVFVGTAIWLQSPAKISILNEKKLIADCYAALQPSNLLIKKLVIEADKLKKLGTVTDEEYYLLRSSRVARELLSVKTMGDPDNFTDRTPDEILGEIHERIRKEEEKRFITERVEHEKTKIILESVEEEKQFILLKIRKTAGILSNIIGCSCYALGLIFIGLFLFDQIYPTYFQNTLFKKALIILTVIINIGSFVYGMNLKNIKDKLRQWIEKKIMDWYKK